MIGNGETLPPTVIGSFEIGEANFPNVYRDRLAETQFAPVQMQEGLVSPPLRELPPWESVLMVEIVWWWPEAG